MTSKLRQWRIQQNKSIEDLSRLSGVRSNYLSMIETGVRTPSLSVALKIERATGGAIRPSDLATPKAKPPD